MNKIFQILFVILLVSLSYCFAHDEDVAKTIYLSQIEGQLQLKYKLEEHMRDMHAQMEEIRKTKNKVRREKLMQSHLKSMHESMSLMNLIGGNNMLHDNREPAYRMTADEKLDYMKKLMKHMMRHYKEILNEVNINN
tara:strand:- start:35662 stop:36072 length:411 start_codon:yes stop_codon:yes gene_type:complete